MLIGKANNKAVSLESSKPLQRSLQLLDPSRSFKVTGNRKPIAQRSDKCIQRSLEGSSPGTNHNKWFTFFLIIISKENHIDLPGI
jgi:hypothetical protein